jgi:bacterial/archaeal transporter family-2 protein
MPYLLLAFAIGCAIPFQAAINNQLKAHVGDSTLMAAFISFSVGTVALAVVLAFSGTRWQAFAGIGEAKGWQLTGGLLGALFVFGTTLLVPRIGAATMVALIVAGQVLLSLLMDHQGWMGLAVREITTTRMIGAALLVAGVLLVNLDQLLQR